MTVSKKRGCSNRLSKGIVGLLLLTQLTACGTLLYPERRGQTNGQIDVGVAALNAVGLLFFFVPGVVAFGVDFMTGAIYLPGGGLANLTEDELKTIKNTPETIDVETFKKVIAQRDDINLPQDVYTNRLNVVEMSSTQSLRMAMDLSTERVAFAQVQ